MKHLVGKKISKSVGFMGDKVEIVKLSVADVLKVQELVKKSEKTKSENEQVKLLSGVIRMAVPASEELTDEDFNTFPIGELNTLSNHILEYSGLGASAQGN